MTKTVSVVVKAIHDSDLEKVLRKLGLYERLTRGELHCSICNRTLTLENLGGLYKEGGEVKLVCNRIECLVKAAEAVSRSRKPRVY